MGLVGPLSLPEWIFLATVKHECESNESLWAPGPLGSPSIYHLCGCSESDFEPPSQARRLSTGLLFDGIFSVFKVIELRTHHLWELGLFQKHWSGSFFQYRQTSVAFRELVCCWKQTWPWNFQDTNLPSSRRKEWVFPKTRTIPGSSEWNPKHRRYGNREESLGQKQQNTISYPWIHVKTQFQIPAWVSELLSHLTTVTKPEKEFFALWLVPLSQGYSFLVPRASLSVRTVISVC